MVHVSVGAFCDEAAVRAWLENDGQGNINASFSDKDLDFTPLMAAAAHGHERVVEMLLQRGADVNLQNIVGVTALMLAVRYGLERVFELLLQRGAEINKQNSYGDTALMFAACCGHPAIVLHLLRMASPHCSTPGSRATASASRPSGSTSRR